MRSRIVSGLLALALSLQATAALAAEPTSVETQPYGNRDADAVDLSNAYTPEAVFVTRVAARAEDGTVTGSFTIENTEKTLVTGLQYRLELRGIGEEDGLPYALDIVRSSIALAANESQTLLFHSPLPAVPAGRYEFRVQLLTAKGRSLGWMDAPVVITEEDGAARFVHLVPGTIGIAAYGDELLPPLSGPNVDPSTAVTLRATATNTDDAALRVLPVVELFDFNASRERVATFDFAALNLAAGESLALNLPLTTEATPGTYMAHLTLRDAATGRTLSTIAQYRFVVKGEDADILAVRIDSMGTTSGDWAYGTVDLAGAADALTKTTATLRVQLQDDLGALGAIEVPGIELTDSILTAKIRIPLDRNLVGNVAVRAELVGENDATYDTVTYAGVLSPAQLSTLTQPNSLRNWVAWHGMTKISLFLFLMSAVGYGLIALALRMRHSNLAFTRTATAAFLLVCFAAQITSSFAAGNGNGIEVLTPKKGSEVFAALGDRPIIALFINQPIHNQQNNFCNRQITLDYRLEFGVCENQISFARVLARVAKNGGLFTTYDPAGAQWETVHDRPYTSAHCTAAACFQIENFSQTIDLTNVVNGNVNETTLQLLAKYGKNIAVPTSSFDRNDEFIRVGWAHAVNLHLRCEPQVGCIDVLKEGFDAQGNRITTPLPNFTFRLDGNQTVQTNAQGRATFSNVPAGQHTVTENPLSGWTQFLVTPDNGIVDVQSGPACVGVIFKNRQDQQPADMRIQKTAVTASIERGGIALFDVTVQNMGPAAAPGVTIGDPVPAGTTFVPAQSDNRCAVQGNAVFCDIGTMQPNQSITVRLAFQTTAAAAGACQTGQLVNNAAVQSDFVDPNLQNNQSSATVQLTCPAPQTGCIEILKEGFDAGGSRLATIPPFTFTLDGGQTVQTNNQGRATFSNVSAGTHTVTETTQAGWELFQITPDNGIVDVQAGAACAGLTFKNRQQQQAQQADIQIQKSGPTSVVRGNTIAYQLIVKNNGPAAAPGVVIGDPLPAGTTFVPAQSDSRCILQGNSVFCDLGTMAVNQQIAVPITVTATLPAGTCQTGQIVNNAAVQSDLVDPNLQNNSSSFTTQVTCPAAQGADVSVQKTGTPSVVRGQNISYQLLVQNAGPATATGVVVSDAIPAGLTLTQADNGCTTTNNTITCAVGSLTAGQSRTLTFVFSTQAQAQNCTPGTVTNTGIVTSTSNDPNAGNNSSSATTQLTCADVQTGCVDVLKETFDSLGNILTPVAQFTFTLDGTRTATNDSLGRARFENVAVGSHTVTETLPSGWNQFLVTPAGGTVTVGAGACATVVFKNRQNQIAVNEGFTISKTDGRSTAEPGDTLTYTITVRNVGLSRQTVVVSDELPDDVEFIDASPNETSENGGTIRWENQIFEPGETKIYEVEVEIDDDADGTLLNTARVQDKTATDRTDVDDDDDDDDDDEDLELEITKRASTAEVFPGGIIDYTVTIENTGDDTIEDITVIDQLPADVIVIDDGDADSRRGRTLEWNIDELDEGDSETFRYRVSVPTFMVAGQIIRNDVCAEADDVDEECASATVIVLGTIPRTGNRVIASGETHLRPFRPSAATPADATLPFLAVLAIAGVGTGAGLGLGRRLLIGM